jgi:anti-anti-sigma factor
MRSQNNQAVTQISKANESNSLRNGGQLERFFDLSLDLLCIAGFDGYFKMLNPAWERTLGFTRQELLARPYIEFIHPDDRMDTRAEQTKLLEGAPVLHFENRYRTQEGRYRWLNWKATPFAGEQVIYAAARDITERKRQEALLAGEKRVLEMLSTGAGLAEILESLTKAVEAITEEMRCSILLLEPQGRRLHPVAGQRLPEAYSRAIDGVEIGPNVGSCGTAAHLRTPVVAADIAGDPRWEAFRDLALAHGLRACWSTPIFCSKGTVLGTFAMYYGEPRNPGETDLKVIERATYLAGIAIEHKRAEENLARAHDQLEARIQERTAQLAATNEALEAEIVERKRAEGEIQKQQESIRRLSTPVLPVRERLLILPMIGEIDAQRARQLTDQLLHGIRTNRARVVVMDMTGVASVDSQVANHLVRTVQAANLLGASVIVTGLSREITQTLVHIGVDLSSLTTLGDLQSGIEEAERRLGYHLSIVSRHSSA